MAIRDSYGIRTIADVQAEYELREARMEISRHHKLIEELRDGLDWALGFIAFTEFPIPEGDFEKFDYYRKVLNRQVS